MAITLIEQFTPYVDELFYSESKKTLFTNADYSWEGAHAIKVWKITTAQMHDYGRTGAAEGNISRYGAIEDLNASVETMTLRKDRSFTFAIDKLDENESGIKSAEALARQLRNVVIPEIDAYVINQMVAHAGTTANAFTPGINNIYPAILAGSLELDKAEVPENERVLLVGPDVYYLMKQDEMIMLPSDVSENMRLNGVIGMVDGMPIIRVPSARLPENFGFMIAHPCATVAPVKLADYHTHVDPPFINGSLIEGRICYDAFVLDNKAKAIYYQPTE